MKAFLSATVVMLAIAFAADALLGGPVFDTGGILVKSGAADVYKSDNVRLD